MTEKFNFEEHADPSFRATYDPDDDKLRIYTDFVARELYDALKGLGFGRAPKQGCFFQVWNPAREDAALALCGEIEDEDSTALERAEERSVRFTGYSANAEARAEQAVKAGNDAVAGIPFGQPILVGHHSERRHRKAVERAQAAADRTVREVDRRDYWAWRAQAVLSHAEHRHDRGKTLRRVKKLEADLRAHRKDALGLAAEWDQIRKKWPDIPEEALWRNGHTSFVVSDILRKHLGKDGTAYLSELIPQLTEDERRVVRERLDAHNARAATHNGRWIEHLEGQIAYWKAILEEKHGIDVDEQLPLAVGGWVRCAYGWGRVERVNKGAEGRVTSVSVNRKTVKAERPGSWFPRIVQYDRILEWSAAEPEAEFRVDPTPVRSVREPDELRQEAEARKEVADAVEVKVNWDPDYFPTPPDVVELMLNEVAQAMKPGSHVLEPSAGDGRIIEAIVRRWGEPSWPSGVTPFWYEVNPTAVETLRAKNLGGLQAGTDFLEAEPDPIYDAVVMNPPFSRGQAHKHVQHAYEFLKSGGLLVTVLPGQARYFVNPPPVDPFSRWVREGTKFRGCADLPDGSFKDAGTGVSAHILVLFKSVVQNDYEQVRLF